MQGTTHNRAAWTSKLVRREHGMLRREPETLTSLRELAVEVTLGWTAVSHRRVVRDRLVEVGSRCVIIFPRVHRCDMRSVSE
jgi:hypothetical protein